MLTRIIPISFYNIHMEFDNNEACQLVGYIQFMANHWLMLVDNFAVPTFYVMGNEMKGVAILGGVA